MAKGIKQLELSLAHAYEELDDAQECNDDERVARLLAAIKRYKKELSLLTQ